jgi:hypothetical protein
MTNEYILPGTSSKQINENIVNDQNIKEGNKNNFVNPQNLYLLLLQRKRCKYNVHKTPLYKY